MKAIVKNNLLEAIVPEGSVSPYAVPAVLGEGVNLRADFVVGEYIVDNGVILVNPDYADTRAADEIRSRREKECFKVCDRAVWFFMLSDEEKRSVIEWRQAWLDAPETLTVPDVPEFLTEVRTNDS